VEKGLICSDPMISFVSCSSPMLLNKKKKDITRLEYSTIAKEFSLLQTLAPNKPQPIAEQNSVNSPPVCFPALAWACVGS